MATLLSGYNPDYSQKASILTGNPNRVTVEVEDTIDKLFWSDILSEECPEKDFHFNPYTTIQKNDRTIKTAGKSRIIKMSCMFNQFHIGCVDSDYDWILSDYLDSGRLICTNKHILQTYAYSIENLMCHSYTLQEICHESSGLVVEFDFPSLIERVSEALYPSLLLSLYLCSKGNTELSPTVWQKVLNVEAEDCQNVDTIVEAITKNRNNVIYSLSLNIEDDTDFQQFVDAIGSRKPLDKHSSYLYVQGHAWFRFILSILKPIVKNIHDQHIDYLKTTKASDIGQVIADYEKSLKRIDRLLNTNYRYKHHGGLYDKIVNDIHSIF